MLNILIIIIGIYISTLLTILLLRLKVGLQELQKLNKTITEKLKTKYEIINEMSVLEAKKKYIRAKSLIFEIIEEAGPLISNMISVALGGKKGGGYREGG